MNEKTLKIWVVEEIWRDDINNSTIRKIKPFTTPEKAYNYCSMNISCSRDFEGHTITEYEVD